MTDLAAPPPDARKRAEEHLFLHLERVAFCLQRLRSDPTPPEPGEEGAEDGLSPAARLGERVAAVEQLIEQRYPEGELPLRQLCERFGIDRQGLHLLVGAAAPALDPRVAQRLELMTGKAQPSVGLLVDALTSSLEEEQAMRAALRPMSPLLRWRLVRLGENPAWSPEAPLVHRPLSVPERIVEWMRGDRDFDPDRFERTAELIRPAERPASGDAVDRVGRNLFRSAGARRLPLTVAGPSLVGKASAIIAAAAARGLPVLSVDLEALAAASDPTELLLDLGREALLQGAVLLLRRIDAVDEKRVELRRRLKQLLGDGALWLAVTTRGAWCDLLRQLGVGLVELELPEKAKQLALWQQALPSTVSLGGDVDLQGLVDRYRLTPGDIFEAGLLAARSAESRDETRVTTDDLVQAVRGRLRHRLGDVAELITTTQEWDDIVLPDSVQSMILELLSSIRYQSRVMNEWGFGHKIAYGRAVSALFSGPPGTGKTMVATLIAKELGLELFRVDLSRVVSKWVGETEKNLGRAFDEAKNSQAVLLFDEADALFAKRTDVRSSNDRYANLEVNYLLQRLETFEGIVLLTTNLSASIDDAFRRRLRFRIEFPSPDEADREALWRAMLPPNAPVAADVDFAELGRRFDMSGGYIKNAVVRAAYLAAASEVQVITHDLLVEAAHLEWEAMGRLAKE